MLLQEQLNKIRRLSGLTPQLINYTYLGEQITRVRWLMLTEEEKIKNLQFNRKDSVIHTLVNKIGASPEMAEWAYTFSDKYCIWLLNAIKTDRGINYITGNTVPTHRITDVIPKLFDVQNKPETPIKGLSLDQAQNYLNRLNYINYWANDPDVATPDLTKMTWDQATAATKEWYEALESDSSIKNEHGTIIHKFPDGCYWINTHKFEDTEEGISAGHCGVASNEFMVLVSLRNSKKEVLLTFDYNETSKEVLQFKGKGNTKPVAKYHPYIVWLLSQKDIIHHLKTNAGFKPENNFQLSDLTQDEQNQVLIANTGLADG